ncbi:serine/threonine-protein kinase Nek2-like [Cornus florida]|uniref:serine/threonine-protein kinase Nek2-like n=1 Tax=Cornus florida TaxID=4283 RepID=UPI0028A1A6F2|nr:serine/threonine-protein kinase Nek2-like [Cornus florida]
MDYTFSDLTDLVISCFGQSELGVTAAELLVHPHLQPYVLKIQHKINSPRRNSLSVSWRSETNYMKKTRFTEPEDVRLTTYREKRQSFSNDRTLNPSVSGAEQDTTFDKKITPKASDIVKAPKLTPRNSPATPKKLAELSKNRESFQASRTPAKKAVPTNRRASLPFPTRAAVEGSPCTPYIGINSPDVSVNSPRIDRIAEFPMTSYESPFLPVRRTSSTSAQGSNSPPQGDHSILKDKCMVQVCNRTFGRLSFTDAWQGMEGTACKLDGEDIGSEGSNQNATAGASSRTSSDLRRRRFDTSSYQQRAEALEGLLEFSARLLQDERFDELGVLLKPFGPGKASPRETAIWLTKSFKENTVKQEDQCQEHLTQVL